MSSIAGAVFRKRILIAVVALVAASLARQAAAQDANGPAPSTITLDRMDASTRFGVQVGFDDGFGMRFEPYTGQVT